MGLFCSHSVLSKYMLNEGCVTACMHSEAVAFYLAVLQPFLAMGFVCFAWGLHRFFWLPFFSQPDQFHDLILFPICTNIWAGIMQGMVQRQEHTTQGKV